MQDSVGAGQAHRTADDLFALLQGDTGSGECLFGVLCLLGHGLGSVRRDVAASVLLEQRCAKSGFKASDRAKHCRDINVQQIGSTCQRAAAHQCQYQGKIGMGDFILHWCNVPLPGCLCLLRE
ncbi:hypothetical protein ALO97_01365 [Pseudomonas syringae pv. tagetis]|uniref:Uncharacterized protein n=1 Tax=Pseudomonas syringae pv. tagetis TaxID=129140 RepID=A0A0Q0BBN6_9PSED|nr:Unknown protein sequence [Pseudomonas syringae pv. tagetis]RMW15269.1 hypothetical protein ALO97_01365 [Pseudomonas syringae pv. tagetis]